MSRSTGPEHHPFTEADQQIWAQNPQIRSLLDAVEAQGCRAIIDAPVTIFEPNDGRLVTIVRGKAPVAAVILVNTRVMGYRLFREISNLITVEDAEIITKPA